jgi:hypothetical protein
MKKILLGLLGLIAVNAFLNFSASADEKAKFVDQKCNKCHAISAAGIELAKGGDEEEEDGEAPPDLSHTGKYHDVAFIKAFLMKTADHVPHDGVKVTKKHSKKFKGTDEELTAMATWLASFK